jgi:hypothetical protein
MLLTCLPQSMSRSRLLEPQDAKCMRSAPELFFIAFLPFLTQSSSLLISKKHEGSLTAREAALLSVSEALGCAFLI